MPEFHEETYSIDMIIAKILTDDRQYDISKLIAAYEYAAQCHEGQVRSSGEPYIIHPVAVAYILLELGMDGYALRGAAARCCRGHRRDQRGCAEALRP